MRIKGNITVVLGILLIALLLAVGFLGYKLITLNSYSLSSESDRSIKNIETGQNVSTGNEKDVLLMPSAAASTEQKQNYYLLVSHFAKKADLLDITQCNPSPVALKINQGESITVKNSDNIAHLLVFGPSASYTIASNSETKISPKFQRGPGVYGYACDKNSTTQGVIQVN